MAVIRGNRSMEAWKTGHPTFQPSDLPTKRRKEEKNGKAHI